jgi:hypothetical protein
MGANKNEDYEDLVNNKGFCIVSRGLKNKI